MKKLFPLLIVFSVLLSCLSACGPEMITVVTEETDTDYVIVRGEFADETEIAAAKTLRKEINTRYDTNIKLRDDFVREGRIEPAEYEIIVGDTNREESQEQELLSCDFVIKKLGNKIVIKGGKPEYTEIAVNNFIENYFDDDGVSVPVDLDYVSEGEYPVKDLTIDGNKITDYTIVHGKSYEDAALNFQTAVEELCGKILQITDETDKAGEKQIRIAVKEDRLDNDTAEYNSKIESGQLIFTGGRNADVRAAVSEYIEQYLSENVDSAINLSSDTDIKGEAMIKTLKILAIGNSFSVDAMEYIYQIAEDLHYEKIVLGDLYIPGCSLSTHWISADKNRSAYEYYKNTSGTWSITSNISISSALKEDDWDFITLQQVSGSSGKGDTYEPYLSKLIEYVTTNATNPEMKLAWHMTWAYQSNSEHAAFSDYDSDQMTMYNAILDTVRENVADKDDMSIIIPSGIAIQNLRETEIGDILTRDGHHLSVPLGRYTAGLTWIAALTEEDIGKVTYFPDGINEEQLQLVIEAVKNATASSKDEFEK